MTTTDTGDGTHDSDATGPAERQARRRVSLLAAVLGALATGLSCWLWVTGDGRPASMWLVAGVGALFVVGELSTVDIEFRRETHVLSFSSVPLVIGIFTLAPIMVLAARLVASLVVFGGIRRQPPFKLLINLVSQGLEIGVAASVVVLLAPSGPFGVGAWPVAALAVILADLTSALIITAAITAYERAWDRSLLRGIWSGVVVAVADLIVAILVVTLYEAREPAALLVFVLGGFIVIVCRAYAGIAGRFHGLELLDRFTRALGEAVYQGNVVSKLLNEAGEILHAERVWLTIRDTQGLRRVELLDQELRIVEPDALDAVVLDCVTERAVLAGAEDPRFPELAASGHHEMIVARLQARSGDELALVVVDRSGSVRPFDDKDRTLFETLAVHAGLALQNVGLVDQLRAEVQMTEHLATHDLLTELPNRTLFHQEVQSALRDLHRTAELTVLLIDIDRFKDVNDTLGHHNGDHLLAEVGRRLRSHLGGADMVARLGGDEFAVLLRGCQNEQDALETARGLAQQLAQPFALAEIEVDIGVSIGVAQSCETIGDAAALLRRADVAMYNAKNDHSGIELYAPDRDNYSPQRLALVGRLRTAIDKHELALVYQPQVDLVTGEVRGCEALVRWPQPGRTPIPPDEFIYIAEHTGLIRPLTRLVLNDAIAQAALWHRQHRNLRMSVNLSPHNMIENGLPEEIAAMLDNTGLPPELLMIELTETTVMSNPDRAVAIMRKLCDIGISIAIDDFGTGHSSLAYLTQLPATELKIDKSFVFAMGTEPAADTVVHAIVDLGHNLGIEVVAEGVETEAAAAALRDMHCAIAQGYLYSRPLDPHAFERWLANHRTEPTPADSSNSSLRTSSRAAAHPKSAHQSKPVLSSS